MSEICGCPALQSLFDDPEELMDLLESMEDDELRIIVRTKDPKVLLKMRKQINEDLDDSAKQLAMDG